MKKQGICNHKKPRKLLNQVSYVMRVKHYSFCIERSYISWNKLPGGKPDDIYGIWGTETSIEPTSIEEVFGIGYPVLV
jgi:hypothetical protein